MKGSVNKGFFSYLLLFLGLILGVVLICLTIMIFSPGTSIFGWIYVRDNAEYKIQTYDGVDVTSATIIDVFGNENEVQQDSENPTFFDFSKLQSITIKSVDSSINVIHGDFDQIIVNNKVKGFMKKSDRIELSVSKIYNLKENSLTIIVEDKNPKLTLNNNKNINLYFKESTYGVLKLNFEILGKGNLDLGSKPFNSDPIRENVFNSLNVVTNSGNVLISKNDKFIKSATIKTSTGDIECKADLNSGVKDSFGLVDFKTLSFETQTGKIKAGDLSASKSISFSAKESYVNVGNLKSEQINCHIESGDFRTGDIEGSLIDGDDIVRNTNFVIGNVSGDVTIPHATKSGFKAGEISGTALISTQSGAISIKELKSRGEITTTSGTIEVLVGENNVGEIKLTTENGTVNAKFQSVLATNSITTNKGKIIVVYKEGLEFKLTAKTSKNIILKNENLEKSNQEIVGYPSIVDSPITTSNTLSLTSQSGNIEISRNANVG